MKTMSNGIDKDPNLLKMVQDLKKYQDDEGEDILNPDASGSGSGSGSNRGSSTNESSLEKQSMDIEQTARRAILAAILVLLVGAAAGASFLYIGISNAKASMEDTFIRRSDDLSKQITGALGDYEQACSWIHESSHLWREDNMTRAEFRTVYEYIAATGLEFYAMEWVPNVTHVERPALEQNAREYYTVNNEFVKDYVGIRGLTPEDPASMVLVPRLAQAFYFPIQFFEPVEKVNGLYHYDVYSAPWEQPSVNKALQTGYPVATPGFKIVASGEQESFTVVLYHPGVRIEGRKPRDLSNILIQIKDLLERSIRYQDDSLGVYIFDTTDEQEPFLGGMDIYVKSGKKSLTWYPDNVKFEEIQGSSDLINEVTIEFGQREWNIVVIPVDKTYEAKVAPVVLGGVLLFVASLLLALWMINNMRRSIQMHRVMTKAAAEASIVNNLFPTNVRERLLREADMGRRRVLNKRDVFLNNGKDKFNGALTSEGIFGSKPIADLHPYTTIMFADLVGFTAWSSTREPTQVFTLLEILYHSFDTLASKRKVFKVETVGDCYVAVAGLPEPRKDHAIVMARFATDCLERMHKLCKALETSLGPDTGDLDLRIGLHSGQVTAGVLRGDKGRFQLFGDTMNMASRMESTSVRNKIQASEATAQILMDSGYGAWLTPRKDEVQIKGKGSSQTYFIDIRAGSHGSTKEFSSDSSENNESFTVNRRSNIGNKKMGRLIDWNVEVLCGLLRQIEANGLLGKIAARSEPSSKRRSVTALQHDTSITKTPNTTVLDEVQEVIKMPDYNSIARKSQVHPDTVQLDVEVVQQLKNLVTSIANKYQDNPFHNFEHASHVTMSVIKMMKRIVDPHQVLGKALDNLDEKTRDFELHQKTFGMQSDPLAQFACAFSALIHDVDHQGVPNSVLVKEESPLAAKYNAKSVAEQNSVDLAWSLLVSDEYEKLRKCICGTEQEFRRFRQLVVNVVLATDIMDKELGAARKARWSKAFSTDEHAPVEQALDRKATIVIEHLIQASDVAHTMQHWHIYVKWNERLFHEMYRAFKAGRIEKDPSEGWHEGEIGFFDFYIIPLAKKLFTCGVFGVSSDEYLNYALMNRKEWEERGAHMVERYIKSYHDVYGDEIHYERALI